MKSHRLNKLTLLVVILTALFFASGNYPADLPGSKEKKTTEKRNTARSKAQLEYLKYIMPKAITDVTSGKMGYKKDANGIYRLVPNEGC